MTVDMLLPTLDTCHRALAARDQRFDGVFFVGVTSTGIYCRPICRVRMPRRENCRFYPSAAAAEAAGFRPCLRCRPELAPGVAPTAAVERLAHAAVTRLQAEVFDDTTSLETLAAGLGVTSRHLRRAVKAVYGASPVQLAQTHRLLLARRLLADTRLTVTEIAGASGFRSLRRFNTLFRKRYRLVPSKARFGSLGSKGKADSLKFQVGYRSPFAWRDLLRYFARCAIPGVECVTENRYARTWRSGSHCGWLRVELEPQTQVLTVEINPELLPVLGPVLAWVRQVFDLDARPDLIDPHLAGDPLLAVSVGHTPGLRVPGGFDGFELAIRTIVGQQVSVAAASTVMARLATAFGAFVATPFWELNRLSLTPATIARLEVGTLARCGLNRQRAEAILALARAVDRGALSLQPVSDIPAALAAVQGLPGIGPWTANYLALRVWRWPDAFLAGDLGVRKALGGLTERATEARSQAWRPWRGYAVLHLWNGLTPVSQSKIPPPRRAQPSLI